MTNNDLYQFEDNQSFFVSFTDIVTLLLIFFIYLTTISNFNATELETVSKHLSSTFNIDSISEKPIETPDSVTEIDPWASLSDTLQINQLPNEALRLSLDQSLLFRPGSADLLEVGQAYLKQLADVIKDQPYRMIIEGHSDKTPIHNQFFKSNWHLSAMRAAEVTATLERFGVPGHQLSCRGFGESRPINSNAKTSDDHSQNRRVQIYIKPIKGVANE